MAIVIEVVRQTVPLSGMMIYNLLFELRRALLCLLVLIGMFVVGFDDDLRTNPFSVEGVADTIPN